MKNKRDIIEKRQQFILQKLKEDKKVSVELLSRRLNVSMLTVRRDLEQFEKQGFVKRYYGGAALIEGAVDTDPFYDKHNDDDEKSAYWRNAVAEKAALLVEDGDTIFINSSRTALAMLDYIHGKKINVITNNASAMFRNYDRGITVMLTGGEINYNKQSLFGDFAISAIKKMKADKCFIGVSGISGDGLVSTATLQVTKLNKLMIERTKSAVVILADHTRIGKTHNFTIAEASQVTHIVTDSLADKEVLSSFADGVSILYADV